MHFHALMQGVWQTLQTQDLIITPNRKTDVALKWSTNSPTATLQGLIPAERTPMGGGGGSGQTQQLKQVLLMVNLLEQEVKRNDKQKETETAVSRVLVT